MPIRARLALLYTALLAAALAAFGIGVFVVLRDELSRSFDSALAANAEHAAGAFAVDLGPGGTLQPSFRLLEQLASTGGRVVVYGFDGAVLVDSAAPGTPPLPLDASDFALAARHAHGVHALDVGTEILRLTVEPVAGTDSQPIGYVAWVASTRSLGDVLDTVRTALFLGGLVVVALAFLAGWGLARRALAPVADVTETARAISLSGDFAARVETGTPGDEIGDLAVAFNEMLAALEVSHQTLQRFLGDASHELRTPLTTVRASLDLARRPEIDPEERQAILADARAEADRMARLVGDLLALARADSGARLEFAPVELDAVLVECVRQQRQASTHVRMNVEMVEPVVVEGDRDRLKELLLILLDNAARYTPAGGKVTASLWERGGWVTVEVTDTGIGIDRAEQDRVFDRLYRGHRAKEMRPSGTGLGLAIARWVVEAHGGTIKVEPREGGGTVATVTLPAAAG